MSGLNASPVSPLPGYLSSCSLGKSSRGSSPSSNRRLRESSLTSPLPTQRFFAFLNDLRRLRHSARPTSLCSSDESEMLDGTREILNHGRSCTCQSRCTLTLIERVYFSASSRKITRPYALHFSFQHSRRSIPLRPIWKGVS